MNNRPTTKNPLTFSIFQIIFLDPAYLQFKAYIRYIEGLTVESNSMCDWKKELSSSRELLSSYSMEEDIEVPVWLDRMMTKEEEGSSLDSLFALRDFMLQEALSVVKFA